MAKLFATPFLVILAALMACSGPTPTPTSTPAAAVAPQPTEIPVPPEPPTAKSPVHCGVLCNREFWEREATVASVQAEIDAGADPAAKGYGGTAALVYAVEFGSNPDIVRLLLEHGADPNVKDDESGQLPLHSAVEEAACASQPVAGCHFSGNADYLSANALATIELLLQSGADAAARDTDGQSALFSYLVMIEAVGSSADARIVRLLLEHGTKFAAWNDTDAFVMVFAMLTRAGPEVIRLLLEYGAGDVAELGGYETLLHMAAGFTAGPQVFSVLLDKGYDVNAEGEFALTPLHMAVLNGEIDPQVVKLLLDSGAELSSKSDGGTTTLHFAAAHSGPEVIRLLLERGADVADRDDLMNTPLHWATEPPSRSHHPGAVNLLLEGGAEVNAKDEDGNTPLHLAVMPSQHWQDPWALEVIELLLNAGADIRATNNDHLTPCDIGPSDEAGIRGIICR